MGQESESPPKRTGMMDLIGEKLKGAPATPETRAGLEEMIQKFITAEQALEIDAINRKYQKLKDDLREFLLPNDQQS